MVIVFVFFSICLAYFGAIGKYCNISTGNTVHSGVKKELNSVCLALGHDTQTQTHTNSHADSNANMVYCDVLITVWQAGRQVTPSLLSS